MSRLGTFAACAVAAALGGLGAAVADELRAAPTSSHLQVGGCDEDGVTVSYDVVYSKATAAFVVGAVTVGDVAAACRAGTATAALRGAGGVELAAAAAEVAGGTVRLPLSPRPRAADVVEVAVALDGVSEAPTATPPATAVAPVTAPAPPAPVPPPAAHLGRSPLCNVADPGSISVCLVGGATRARLVGSAGRDVLVAGTAGDVLLGRGGADFLYGGRGDDRIAGGDGGDLVEGRGGDDRLYGGHGDDRMHGGAGRDRIEGGHGDDRIDGGPGFDVCIGGPGRDRFTRCEATRP
ncbi:MAG TPA: calcium-binding protein [Gaiellaceae bacterium]|nr:calcium-binding protein [Gaiellaceae bacterium]